MSFRTNIFYDTTENRNFRTVLYTGKNSQLVLMSIPPGEDIGVERHDAVEQTLVIVSGSGLAILNGDRHNIRTGDVLIITPGTEHNILNTAAEPMKLFTIYAPPNHLDGRVHATKADADRDSEDEAFGEEAGGLLHTLSSNGSFSGVVTPGFVPELEPHPAPSSPLENPEEPAISIHD